MANDKAFKIKNGLSATRYLQSAGADGSGSVAYNLAGASYDSKTFSVNSWETAAVLLDFKSDGTKMYVGGQSTDTVRQYSLSTAWDITTASYDSKSLDFSAQETSPQSFIFGDSGTKCYVIGSGNDTVYQYTVSTAWDISTASYASKSLSVGSQDTVPLEICFSNDGTKLFVTGATGDDVNEYTLSTAWDVSTGTFVDSFSVSAQTVNPRGIAFNADGTKMFVLGSVEGGVFQYSLTTAFDVSTASYDSVIFDTTSQDGAMTALRFGDSGSKMYTVGASGNDAVYQYSTVSYTEELDLSTGTYFSFTPSGATTVSFTNPPPSGKAAAYSVVVDNTDGELFAAGAVGGYTGKNVNLYTNIGGSPQGIYFKSDGTKFFVSENANDSVWQYSMSTAWDVSTATYDSVVYAMDTVATFNTANDLVFKPDGTAMYSISSSTDAIYQYTLSTAWDISTASYAGQKSVNAEDTNPHCIAFNNDGTVMFMAGHSGDSIYKYTLSTAWKVSTASYDSVSLNIGTDGITGPTALQFNSTGTILLVLCDQTDSLYQYNLSTAYDISTATLSSDNAFYVDAGMTTPANMYVREDTGTLYVLGRSEVNVSGSNDAHVYQYNIGSAGVDLTWPSTVKWHKGITPSKSPDAGKKMVCSFLTTDGGSSYIAKKVGEV
jgi:sugar lactone lactonase YvrE